MHIEKLSWAVGLMRGAERIVVADRNTPINEIALPFYLLIGFSIENALKAYLQFRSAMGGLNRSHDLNKLLDASLDAGLNLPDEIAYFIRELRDSHADFTFRYPEKAGWVSLFKAEPALRLTNNLLELITRSFPLEDIHGWQPDPMDFVMGNLTKPKA